MTKHKEKYVLKDKRQLSLECLNHTLKNMALQDAINIIQMFYCVCLHYLCFNVSGAWQNMS